MGTTLTLAYSVGVHLFLIHVGDSRAYLFRRGQLQQLTRDHTVAQALADAGQIKQEDVRKHPKRNTLTNYLGGHRGKIKADVRWLRLEDGDRRPPLQRRPQRHGRGPGRSPGRLASHPDSDTAALDLIQPGPRERRQGQHHGRRRLLRHPRPAGRQAAAGRDRRTGASPRTRDDLGFPRRHGGVSDGGVGSRR